MLSMLEGIVGADAALHAAVQSTEIAHISQYLLLDVRCLVDDINACVNRHGHRKMISQ